MWHTQLKPASVVPAPLQILRKPQSALICCTPVLQVAFLYVGGVMLFNGFIIQQSARSRPLLHATGLMQCTVSPT